MALRQKEIKLSDGTICYLQKWTVTECFSQVDYFLEIFGVPLSQLQSAGEEGLSDVLPEAINILAIKLRQAGGADSILQRILGNVSIVPKTGGSPVPLNVDEHLDDLGLVLELCARVMKENYGSLGKQSITNLMSIFSTIKGMNV